MATKQKLTLPSGLLAILYGDRGVGKTMFALRYPGDPKKVLFFDNDSRKSKELCEQLGFDYIDLKELTAGMDDADGFDKIRETFEGIKKSYDLIVIDNPMIVTNGAFAHVVANMDMYRRVVRGNAQIIGAIQWKTAREIALPALYNTLRQKAKIVLVLAHEKDQNIDGIKTGGKEADVDPSLVKACSPMVRLVFGDKTPVPNGLVVKGLTQVVDGVPRNILPPRVEGFTWEKISYYMENPFGTRAPDPAKGEVPSDDEYALIHATLTPEMQKLFEFNMEMARRRITEDMSTAVLDAINKVDKLNLVTATQIVSELKGQYPDLTPQKVMEISKTAQK